MSDRSEIAPGVLRRYFTARNAASKICQASLKNPEKRRIQTFPFSTTPTSTEFERLYDRRLDWYKSIGVLKIPGSKANGTKVEIPVTVDYRGQIEDHSHHIVSICRADGWRGGQFNARVEIVIRQADNYIVAFRVLQTLADRWRTPWCVFADAELPSYFGKQVKMKYTTTHGKLEKVRFSSNVLEDIFRFLADLQSDPGKKTTGKGKIYFVTLFVLLGEAQRFYLLQLWFKQSALSHKLEKIPKPILDLFTDWSSISKMVFAFYVKWLQFSIYKAAHQGEEDYEDSKNPFHNKAQATKLLERMLRKHGETLSFEPDERGFYLVGRDLLLLNSNKTNILDILMLQHGYDGILLNKKRYDEALSQEIFEEEPAEQPSAQEPYAQQPSAQQRAEKSEEERVEGEQAKATSDSTTQEIDHKRRSAQEPNAQQRAEKSEEERIDGEHTNAAFDSTTEEIDHKRRNAQAQQPSAQEPNEEEALDSTTEQMDRMRRNKKIEKKNKKKKNRQLKRFTGGGIRDISEEDDESFEGKSRSSEEAEDEKNEEKFSSEDALFEKAGSNSSSEDDKSKKKKKKKKKEKKKKKKKGN